MKSCDWDSALFWYSFPVNVILVEHVIDAGRKRRGYRAMTMTPASHECVGDLPNKSTMETTTEATNEAGNACDARPNLPIETLYHAVYIPEYRAELNDDGNLIKCRFAFLQLQLDTSKMSVEK